MVRKLVLAVAFLIVAGCTPEQLTAWQSHTGTVLTPEQQAPLLALDDVPYRDGRLTINPDGTLTDAGVAVSPWANLVARSPVKDGTRILGTGR
jgi:hypothetical protein